MEIQNQGQRRKIIIGCAILAAALLLGILVYLLIGDSDQCVLVATQPELESRQPQVVVATDQRAKVAFNGYLKYEPSKLDHQKGSRYAQLNVRSVALNDAEASLNLLLLSDCALVTLILTPTDARGVEVTKIKIDLSLENEGVKSCEISSRKDLDRMQTEFDEHYYCDQVKTYDCWTRTEGADRLVATLVVGFLEFEVSHVSQRSVKVVDEFGSKRHRCV